MSRGAEQALAQPGRGARRRKRADQGRGRVPAEARRRREQEVGLTIPRLAVERDADGVYRYSLLVVRGGNPRGEFEGHLELQAVISPVAQGSESNATQTPTLLDDQADGKSPIPLKFKYYQRVEGTLRVPPDARLTALTARAYENGSPDPRVTRSLSNP